MIVRSSSHRSIGLNHVYAYALPLSPQRLRRPVAPCAGAIRNGAVSDELREPEIGKRDVAVCAVHDVAGFDVAVQDAEAMESSESESHLCRNPVDFYLRQVTYQV